ncbi:MAG: YkvA family protein [Acidimicrobiales bacterium]
MWIAAGALVVAGSAAVVGLLALAAHLLPPGRGKELAGFIPNCLVLLRRLRADRRLPWRARVVLGAALAYLLSPIQLIPNFIPVIGQTDDLVVVTLALRYACRRLPRDDVRAAWPGNPDHLDRLLGRARPTERLSDED